MIINYDVSDLIDIIDGQISSYVEDGTTASRAYAVGDRIIWKGVLYKVISAISNGATLTAGTNVQATTVGDDLARIGTVVNGTDVTTTIPSGSYTEAADIALTPGTWVISVAGNFTSAFSEAFYMRLMNGANTLARENVTGAGGGGISLSAITVLTSNTTLKIEVYQGSGSSKTLTYLFRAVRIC